ncbi:unannotated protein [freshwater metagenome]|uniref:Unannotated protein n=1 Tax=freshwater metagenome TaxID=449393 RepID=A0A6J5ZY94_9ZZZZ
MESREAWNLRRVAAFPDRPHKECGDAERTDVQSDAADDLIAAKIDRNEPLNRRNKDREEQPDRHTGKSTAGDI